MDDLQELLKPLDFQYLVHWYWTKTMLVYEGDQANAFYCYRMILTEEAEMYDGLNNACSHPVNIICLSWAKPRPPVCLQPCLPALSVCPSVCLD